MYIEQIAQQIWKEDQRRLVSKIWGVLTLAGKLVVSSKLFTSVPWLCIKLRIMLTLWELSNLLTSRFPFGSLTARVTTPAKSKVSSALVDTEGCDDSTDYHTSVII